MKGCFAVTARKSEETRRFIIGLDYLTDPTFLGLLDEACEEFGFQQKGTLLFHVGR
jgi:SAUR family protein